VTSRRRGTVLVLTGTALFGTIGTARLLGPDASALSVAFARMVLASGLMVAVATTSAAFAGLPRPGWHGAIRPLLRTPAVWVAGVGQACFQVSFLAAVTTVGVATGTLVAIGTTPLLTGLVATVRTRRPTGSWLTCTALGVLGLYLLVGVGDAADPLGLLVALAASASYATFILAGAQLTRLEQPIGTALPVVFCIATLTLSPALPLSDWSWLPTGDGIVMLAWLATVPTVLAYALFNRGLGHVEAPVAATLGLVEPLVATVLAVVLLDESLGWVQLLGALLIGSAVVAVARVGPQVGPAVPTGAR